MRSPVRFAALALCLLAAALVGAPHAHESSGPLLVAAGVPSAAWAPVAPDPPPTAPTTTTTTTEPAPPPTAPAPPTTAEVVVAEEAAAPAPAPDYTSLEPCGPDAGLPPCWVKARESRGNYGAVNQTGCSGRKCWGAWQFDPLTWDHQAEAMGRPDLVGVYLAAPADQDAVARYTWAGGAGCGNWAAC